MTSTFPCSAYEEKILAAYDYMIRTGSSDGPVRILRAVNDLIGRVPHAVELKPLAAVMLQNHLERRVSPIVTIFGLRHLILTHANIETVFCS